MLDRILIRKGCIDDAAFIFSSWLGSYKTYSVYTKRIRDSIYYTKHQQLLTKILSRPTTGVVIAHLDDAPEIIIGYLVYEHPNIAHFVYVKKDWRGEGVARKLLEGAHLDFPNCVFTHWTYPMDMLTQKHPTLVYDPYQI